MSNLNVIITVSLSILAVFIVIPNAIVIGLVLWRKKMRNFTNGFVCSLAVSDFIYGAAFIPGYLVNPGLEMNRYLISLVLFSNIANIASLTAERYIAVLKPLQYVQIMSRHFVKMITASWLIPVFITIIPVFWQGNIHTIYHKAFEGIIVVLLIILPYAFILFTYCYIFKAVRRQVKNAKRRSHEKNRVSNENKICKVFATIAALSTIAWLPIVFMTACELFEKRTLITMELSVISLFTLSLNSLSNPLLFALYKSDFKQAIRQVFISDRSRLESDFVPEPPTTSL